MAFDIALSRQASKSIIANNLIIRRIFMIKSIDNASISNCQPADKINITKSNIAAESPIATPNIAPADATVKKSEQRLFGDFVALKISKQLDINGAKPNRNGYAIGG